MNDLRKCMKAFKQESLPVKFYVQSCQSAEQVRAYSLLQTCKYDLQETAGDSPVIFNQRL